MRSARIAAFALAFLAAACGGGSGQGSATERFVQGCLASSNLDREFCECAAKQAARELPEDGYAFLVATLNEDEQEASKIRAGLAPSQAMAAGMFMVKVHASCAPGDD